MAEILYIFIIVLVLMVISYGITLCAFMGKRKHEKQQERIRENLEKRIKEIEAKLV